MITKKDLQSEKNNILRVKRYEELKKKGKSDRTSDEDREFRNLEDLESFEHKKDWIVDIESEIKESDYDEQAKRMLLAGVDYLKTEARKEEKDYRARRRVSGDVRLNNSGSMSRTEIRSVRACLKELKLSHKIAESRKKDLGRRVDASGKKVGEYQSIVARAISGKTLSDAFEAADKALNKHSMGLPSRRQF